MGSTGTYRVCSSRSTQVRDFDWNHILVKFDVNLKCALSRHVKKLREYLLSNPKTNKKTL